MREDSGVIGRLRLDVAVKHYNIYYCRRRSLVPRVLHVCMLSMDWCGSTEVEPIKICR